MFTSVVCPCSLQQFDVLCHTSTGLVFIQVYVHCLSQFGSSFRFVFGGLTWTCPSFPLGLIFKMASRSLDWLVKWIGMSNEVFNRGIKSLILIWRCPVTIVAGCVWFTQFQDLARWVLLPSATKSIVSCFRVEVWRKWFEDLLNSFGPLINRTFEGARSPAVFVADTSWEPRSDGYGYLLPRMYGEPGLDAVRHMGWTIPKTVLWPNFYKAPKWRSQHWFLEWVVQRSPLMSSWIGGIALGIHLTRTWRPDQNR